VKCFTALVAFLQRCSGQPTTLDRRRRRMRPTSQRWESEHQEPDPRVDQLAPRAQKRIFNRSRLDRTECRRIARCTADRPDLAIDTRRERYASLVKYFTALAVPAADTRECGRSPSSAPRDS
jgi:hypothetical protein